MRSLFINQPQILYFQAFEAGKKYLKKTTKSFGILAKKLLGVVFSNSGRKGANEKINSGNEQN
jgi:hypothetical protein